MNKNQKIWIGVGVGVVVMLLVWMMNKSSMPTTSDNGTSTDTSQTAIDSTEDTTAGSIDVGAPAATLSYSQALVKYANARMQLDANCQVNAQSQKMTFRNNAYLMIDNRSDVAHTVKVGSTFSVKAYGFKIVQLSSATLPVTWLVDCGSSQNVATVTIQK